MVHIFQVQGSFQVEEVGNFDEAARTLTHGKVMDICPGTESCHLNKLKFMYFFEKSYF